MSTLMEQTSAKETKQVYNNHNDEELEIDLMDLLRKVIGIRKKIYKAAGIGLIIGVIVAISIPKQYTVEVTLSPEMGNDKAGGYSENAKKSKKFIVYMNGQVTKVKGSGKKQIEPGCEIIVPSKAKKKTNIGNILGYATTFSTLGMMVASIANLIKK